jgi:hypothetical protein
LSGNLAPTSSLVKRCDVCVRNAHTRLAELVLNQPGDEEGRRKEDFWNPGVCRTRVSVVCKSRV